MPVPESLISPMVSKVPDIPVPSTSKSSMDSSGSSYYSLEQDEISTCKLKTIQSKANEIRSRRTISDQGTFFI